MSQKNGKKNLMINITQCPFLIDMTPRVTTNLGPNSVNIQPIHAG